MNLQDIHKEFDERYQVEQAHMITIPAKGVYCLDSNEIKDFYDKKIVEILKDSMEGEYEDATSSFERGWNKCTESFIRNLKARNINLD